MKKNIYYRRVLRRENKLQNAIFDFFLKFCSYYRLVLEVFIRKNFGVRYFSMASVVTVGMFLLFLPIGLRLLPFPTHYNSMADYTADQGWHFWVRYAAWYLFTFAFFYFAWQRRKEIRRNPSVFDFGKFSLYSGDIDPRFFNLHPFGKKPTIRQVETLFEPALFFAAGGALWLIGQKLGVLLMTCSVFYGLGYAGAYKKGDDFVMDKIDEMILNEDLEDVFVNDVVNSERGVRFYADKPDDKTLRRKLADAMVEDGPAEEVTFAEEV